jgi:RHS repeat-associated protein
LRFPGHFDEETGLHYNYFRSYDAVTGRYVQSGPIGLAGGLSTYLYANADPISMIDPLGG